MGCDIHMYVEYRDDSTQNWVSGDLFRMINTSSGPEYNVVEIYNERNYSLFGILAGVRNMDYEPISYPKGLPKDTCEIIKKEYQKWIDDLHSASYLTLRELIDYNDRIRQTDFLANSILEPIIELLKERAHRLHFIPEYYWAFAHLYKYAYDKSNDIRIVFWFDN